MRPSNVGAMAALAVMAGPALAAVRSYELTMPEGLEPMRKTPPKAPAQSVIAPPVWENEHVNTRQVRRQRARLAAKKRDDYPPTLHPPRNTSRYMPHIGAKERGRYAS